MRRHVEVTDQHARRLALLLVGGPEAFEEIQLVGELVIHVRVRLIAAGGQVDIVNLDARDFRSDHTGMSVPTKIGGLNALDGQARGDGHTVMTALLTVQHEMRQAHFAKRLFREFPVLAFRFLQADHVRLFGGDKGFNIRRAQADRIDVPADNFERVRHSRCVTVFLETSTRPNAGKFGRA